VDVAGAGAERDLQDLVEFHRTGEGNTPIRGGPCSGTTRTIEAGGRRGSTTRRIRAEVGLLQGEDDIARLAAASEDTGLGAAVRVAEIRYRNGLAVAWIRIGLRLLTLTLWIASAVGGAGPAYWEAATVNALHLGMGLTVLALLRRRFHVSRVLLLASVLDLLVLAFAGVRTEAGDGASVGYLMGVFELLLLLAALTLPRPQVITLAAAATAFQAWLGIHVGIEIPYLVATVLTLGAFSLAATLAGSRMIDLAARHGLDDYAGLLVRTHRDQLAAANAEIAAQRDQLVAAQRQSTTLTQLIVHDLRNPLSSILQFISLAGGRARQHGGLEELEEDLRLAGEEGQRLAGMVGDLLLLARLESGAMQLKPQSVPVRVLLESVARSIQPRAEERRVAVSVRGDPELMARFDLDLMRRLLENLLVNALRHVRPGDRIELDARQVGPELLVAVRNSGPPVPETVRGQLFQKHGPGADRQWHNAGLGLYLCRLVAEAHGGQMALAETPGWPVAFEARLPAARA
jgi:signal transduction histidine kinase